MPIESAVDACLGTSQIQAIVDRQATADDLDRIKRHAQTCGRCAKLLAMIGALPPETAKELQEAQSQASRPTGCDVSQHPTTSSQPASSTPEASIDAGLAPTRVEGEARFVGGYRIVRTLGEGGMGVVYEAEDVALGRHVAIKMLRPGQVDTTQRRRFLQEAQLAASLSSDRIVTIYQVGEENGCPFIVMELLRGESLEARLDKRKTLPVAEALRIAREVAEGLAAAHSQHLIHRDIKPANVWLEERTGESPASRTKLLDFGIARPLEDHGNLTMAGQVIGTPSYMSPEQARGRSLDERTDLYSVGCLIFAMIAGRPPHDGTNYLHVLRAIVDEKTPRLTDVTSEVPTEVDRLVARLLQKDPAMRPATARQLVDELSRIENGLGRTLHLADEPLLASQTAVRPIRPRLGWGGWCGAAAIVAAVAIGIWVQYARMRDQAAPAAQVAIEEVVQPAESPAALRAASELAVPLDEAREATETPVVKTAAVESSAAAVPPASTNDQSPASDAQAADDQAAPVPADPNLPPVRVGIVHSLSGAMAVSERSIVDAWQMAFDEINANGGVLGGRPIEVLVRDGQSDENVFAQAAEELIDKEHVATVFGCWRSPCRKTVELVCRRYKNLLVYPMAYEGLEQSPNVIYMGGAPNQQVLPAVKWAFAFLNKRKFFLVGADGVYSHAVHAMIRDELKQLGGSVVGEEYQLLGATEFDGIARKIAASQADLVVNTVSGAGNVSLFGCLRRSGIHPPEVPTLSFRVSEEELQTISARNEELAGDYAAWSYFQGIDNDQNQGFIDRLRQRFGLTRVANDPMAAAYAGAYLWAAAVDDCKSEKPAEICRAMLDQSFNVPEGEMLVDPATQHARRRAMVGQVNGERQYDIVWASPAAIAPEPYPPSRSRDQWQSFLRDLFRKWRGHWRPDYPGHEQDAQAAAANVKAAAKEAK